MAKNAVYPLDPIGIRHAVRCQWCSRRHPTGAMFKRRGRHGHDVPKGWVGQRVPAQKGPFWASETCSVKHIALDCVYKQLYFTCVYILTLKVPIKKPKWMILHQHLVIFCHGWSRYQSLQITIAPLQECCADEFAICHDTANSFSLRSADSRTSTARLRVYRQPRYFPNIDHLILKWYFPIKQLRGYSSRVDIIQDGAPSYNLVYIPV